MACESDPVLRRALTILLHGCGFGLVTEVEDPGDVLPVAARVHPHAVVLDLALTGSLGLRLLPKLLEAAPGSALVVVCPFPALREPALALGARQVVAPSDLRPLRHVLETARTRPNLGCTCCSLTAAAGGAPEEMVQLGPRHLRASQTQTQTTGQRGPRHLEE